MRWFDAETLTRWAEDAATFDTDRRKAAPLDETAEDAAAFFLEAGFNIPAMVAKLRPLLGRFDGKPRESMVVRLAGPDVVEVEHWARIVTRYALTGRAPWARRILDARRPGSAVLVVERGEGTTIEAHAVEPMLVALDAISSAMCGATRGRVLQ